MIVVAANAFIGIPLIYWALYENDLLCLKYEANIFIFAGIGYWFGYIFKELLING